MQLYMTWVLNSYEKLHKKIRQKEFLEETHLADFLIELQVSKDGFIT